ncbi:hypothetical protein ACMATS_36575 [Streptoverticillium reticulum]|uniref:hypothetical protein n=1 Tax=Streptoverticillium reticulum TaxID=1433415 RepID=UPI0039BFB698
MPVVPASIIGLIRAEFLVLLLDRPVRATAIGHPRDLVPDLAKSALPVVRGIYGSLPRTLGGSFAPPQPVPHDASALGHLVGYLGRTVN